MVSETYFTFCFTEMLLKYVKFHIWLHLYLAHLFTDNHIQVGSSKIFFFMTPENILCFVMS